MACVCVCVLSLVSFASLFPCSVLPLMASCVGAGVTFGPLTDCMSACSGFSLHVAHMHASNVSDYLACVRIILRFDPLFGEVVNCLGHPLYPIAPAPSCGIMPQSLLDQGG